MRAPLCKLVPAAAVVYICSLAPLRAQIPIGGRVLADGEPPAKATVTLHALQSSYITGQLCLAGSDDSKPVARAESGPDGLFHVAAPEAGMWRLRIEASGYVPHEESLEPLLDSTELPEIDLEEDVGLTVQVLDIQGAPLEASLWALPTSRVRRKIMGRLFPASDLGSVSARFARTDSEGRARLAAAPEEFLHLQVVAVGYVPDELQVRAGQDVIVRLRRGQERPIRVLDPRRRPVAGALVFDRSGPAPVGQSDDKGRLVLVVPTQRRVLEVLASDGRRGSHVLTVQTAEEVELQEAATVVVRDPPYISGRVIDRETRRPIAGALVWPSGRASDATHTDSRGGYEQIASESRRSFVNAAARGYAQGRSDLLQEWVDAGRGPTMVLEPAASLSGTVTDETDRAIAGVEIDVLFKPEEGSRHLRRPSSWQYRDWHARTSRRGAFVVRGLPAKNSYELRFHKQGFAPARAMAEHLQPFERRSDLRVVLPRGWTGVGLVADRREVPIAGAEVKLIPTPGSGGWRRVDPEDAEIESYWSDGEGRYEIANLSAGRFRLEARAPGFAAAKIPGIEIPEGVGEMDLGTIYLSPGVSIEGWVLDPQRQPVAGAEIRTSTQAFMPAPYLVYDVGDKAPQATSGPDGLFRIEDLSEGERLSLLVEKSGFAPTALTGVLAPTLEPLEVLLKPAGRVAGRVVTSEGSPVPGVSVNLSPEGKGGTGRRIGLGQRAETEADGDFEFLDVEPGTVTIRAMASGFRECRLSGLQVPSGGELGGLELVLELGSSVEGRVLAPDGTPVYDAWVRVESGGPSYGIAATDGDGRYRLDGLDTGPHRLLAEHEDYGRAVRELEIQPGANDLDIPFKGGVEVAGRVSDDLGNPIGGALVALESSGRSWLRPEVSTSADGTFLFPGVQAGSYTVSATKEDFARSRSEEPLEVGESPVYGLELVLETGASLRGQLLGVEPEELADLSIWAFGEEGFVSRRRGDVSFEGSYLVRNLAPGEWTVRASVAGTGRQALGKVAIEPGQEEVILDLEFGGGLVLSGWASHGGQPLQGARVYVSGLSVTAWGSTVTDQDGRFQIEDLSAGDYRLSLLHHSTGLDHSEELSLEGDREIHIDLATGTLAGRVRDALDSSPLAGARVTLEPLDPGPDPRMLYRVAGATSDSRGYFSLGEVPDGTWRLMARRSGYAPTEATVSISAGSSMEDLELVLRPTEGILFEVALASGRSPDSVMVAILDGARRVTGGYYSVTDEGRVRIDDVPPGQWEMLISAEDSAVAAVLVTSPGELRPLRLPAGGELELEVTDLLEEGVPATLRLTNPQGQTYRAVTWQGHIVTEPRLRDGRVSVPNLEAGSWSLLVTASDGRSWSGTADISPHGVTELSLP